MISKRVAGTYGRGLFAFPSQWQAASLTRAINRTTIDWPTLVLSFGLSLLTMRGEGGKDQSRQIRFWTVHLSRTRDWSISYPHR